MNKMHNRNVLLLGYTSISSTGNTQRVMWQQPSHSELGGLEQFKALSTYWGVEASGQPRSPKVLRLASHHPSRSIKRSPWRLLESKKQPTSEVGARVSFLHPATCFTLIQCSVCRCVRGTCWGGQAGRPPPTSPVRAGTRGVFRNLQCQMRFLKSCLHLTPEMIPSNIPKEGGWSMGGGRPHMFYVQSRSYCAICVPAPPVASFARRRVGFSVRAFRFILPGKDDDISVYRRCLLSGSVGWTCLSAANPPL